MGKISVIAVGVGAFSESDTRSPHAGAPGVRRCESRAFYRDHTVYACASQVPTDTIRKPLPWGLDEMRTLTYLDTARTVSWACQASPTSPMLARLASVLHDTRVAVTVRPTWATANSTPAKRAFCTLKLHVRASASKAAPKLFDVHAMRSATGGANMVPLAAAGKMVFKNCASRALHSVVDPHDAHKVEDVVQVAIITCHSECDGIGGTSARLVPINKMPAALKCATDALLQMTSCLKGTKSATTSAEFCSTPRLFYDGMEEDVPAQVAGHTNLASLMSCDQREEAFGFLLDANGWIDEQEQRAELSKAMLKSCLR